MERDKRITIPVSQSEKKDIDEYIRNETGYTGFSDFFRKLAHQEMSSDDEGGGTAEVDTLQIKEAVESVVFPVEQQLDEIEERLTLAMIDEQDKERIHEVMMDLYEHLPRQRFDEYEFDESPQELRSSIDGTLDERELRILSDKVSWARFLDEPEIIMERALHKCTHYYPSTTTEEIEVDGEEVKRYYVRD